jgi:hypothetical protein
MALFFYVDPSLRMGYHIGMGITDRRISKMASAASKALGLDGKPSYSEWDPSSGAVRIYWVIGKGWVMAINRLSDASDAISELEALMSPGNAEEVSEELKGDSGLTMTTIIE